MPTLEAPQAKPFGELYLGYRVPDEFRPVERFAITHRVLGFGHIIYFFLSATIPDFCTEEVVKQNLPYIHPLSESNEIGEQLWSLAKQQLQILPDGPKVLSYIAANRPDLA